MYLLTDEQTRHDLEIFVGRHGQLSLFKMLDNAKTVGGEVALRRRVSQPYSNVSQIESVQSSITFILRNHAQYHAIPSQYAVSGFENYFRQRLTSPVSGGGFVRIFEGVLLRVDDPRDYSRIILGVGHAVLITNWFRSIVAAKDEATLGSEIRNLLDEAEGLLQRSGFRGIPTLRFPRWFWSILSVDRYIRDVERESFARLISILYEIDALSSLAIATKKYSFVLPELCEGPPMIQLEGVYHPFLEGPVRNSVRVDQAERLLFLTGPNMAGKTTFLRACGVAIYLAHLGMGVPATRMRFTPAEAYYTAISLTDDLRAGISFFQAEALRARIIAEALASGLRVVAILDEPFKGTNVKDALDASCAFFTRVARFQGSLFFVASHLIEAAEPLSATGLVGCRRFEAIESGGSLEFDYLMKSGVSAQRLGMRVLEQHGVLVLLDGRLSNGDATHG